MQLPNNDKQTGHTGAPMVLQVAKHQLSNHVLALQDKSVCAWLVGCLQAACCPSLQHPATHSQPPLKRHRASATPGSLQPHLGATWHRGVQDTAVQALRGLCFDPGQVPAEGSVDQVGAKVGLDLLGRVVG